MMKEKCDCEVNEIIATHKKNPCWYNCMKWDATHWWLRCPTHRVYLLIEEYRGALCK